ncbi:YbaL family putative K(+) efflux transporter [Asaia krungthepensis]|uniref:Sodium/hydrogen exchanger n=1 Tax=Asaia krungthepensis NRIC 0535 TaxID=1307925 RepID=A0ABQ0Q529_9PROT|nr:YbaL family putative K(+) efflux transporter [Asaia krungthepensis]GBQ91821.1 sodium/hydrogen exchanger [Asaia krungthepensis NRIC 0535]
MSHDTPLIGILVVGLGLAFILGTIAQRIRISPLVGYLLAGIAVGPFTPGFVADQPLAAELSEIGIILLMFGVGLHFSLKDLISVRAIAVPGALLQVASSIAIGAGVAWMLDMPIGACIIFGIALSVASTVVLLRTLQEQRLIETERGRLSVGWLIIQDLVTVLALVILPLFAPIMRSGSHESISLTGLGLAIALTLGKVAAFMALMLVIGRRVIPAILHYVAHTGSRELFRLALLALALGVAFIATEWFDVSFALGAFVAGMVLSESELSHRAAAETLPLRDAFAVLFFISVGMLFNPLVLIRQPLPLILTFLVILVGTPLAVIAILRLLRQPWNTTLFIASGLAQIGEFSFILAALGMKMKVLDGRAQDLILGASILSILINPFILMATQRIEAWITRHSPAPAVPVKDETGILLPPPTPTQLEGHAVIVGCGRVGRLVVEGLVRDGWRALVVETGKMADPFPADNSIELMFGNAAEARTIKAMNLEKARLLMVAIPEPFEAGQIIAQAKAINPNLMIVARAHFDSAVAHLKELGADHVIMGEREMAMAMLATAVDDLPFDGRPPMSDPTIETGLDPLPA